LDLPNPTGNPSFRFVKKTRLLIFGLVAFCQSAEAVVIASGGLNNTASGGPQNFNNVGTLNGASAIYLANGWVLTANHVSSSLPASVNFGGTNYATEVGSFHRLTNDGPLSTFTDIVLFRLSAPPALPGVTISGATPTVASQVTMIGNGRTQQSAPTYWNRTEIVGNNNDTWVETTEGASNISGFKTTATNQVRWGENAVDDNNFYVNVGSLLNPVDVVSFLTRFDSGIPEEAQAVVGDSGGAVFSNNGGSWELSGMMFAVGTYETQPGGAETAVYGGETYIADLSYYRSQILTIIPEPSACVLALLGASTLVLRRRSRV
jgi:hypothetical protein